MCFQCLSCGSLSFSRSTNPGVCFLGKSRLATHSWSLWQTDTTGDDIWGGELGAEAAVALQLLLFVL